MLLGDDKPHDLELHFDRIRPSERPLTMNISVIDLTHRSDTGGVRAAVTQDTTMDLSRSEARLTGRSFNRPNRACSTVCRSYLKYSYDHRMLEPSKLSSVVQPKGANIRRLGKNVGIVARLFSTAPYSAK
jgi:hypothetical protein